MSGARHGAGARVALVVDHPERDLAGLVLVALALARRGATCFLVPHNWPRELWALAPDLVLLNYFRRGKESLARQLVEAGIGLGVLDTEGGVWADIDSYGELLWTDAALRARLQPVCVWGPRLAAALVARGQLRADQVRLTGCPRFDFYDARWRPVLASDRPAGATERRAPLLLLNTNFSVANPRFATAERNAEQLRREFAWPAERVRAYMARERTAIDAMIALVRWLTADFPTAEVLLRPHPFEDPTPYERALAQVPRVRVDPSGPVQQRIFGAAAVIQRSCSTAVEAGLAAVPALSPRWIVPPVEIPVAEQVSVACATYEDLRAAVQAILDGSFVLPAATRAQIEAVVRDWFLAADGAAHERVAAAIWETLGDQRPDARTCRRHLYGLHDEGGVPWPSRLGSRARHALRLSPEWSFGSWRRVAPSIGPFRDKFFDTHTVAALVERIDAATGARPAVQVRSAAEHGDYICALRGRAVTLAPAAPAAPAAPGRARWTRPAGDARAKDAAGAPGTQDMPARPPSGGRSHR